MTTLLVLCIRQLTGKSRLALTIALAALPVILGLILKIVFGSDSDGKSLDADFINVILDGMLVATVMPILVMTLATASFGHELEDRTLSFLILKPISRLNIVVSKLGASIIIALPLVTSSGIALAVIETERDLNIAATVGIALAIGTIAYSAVFSWAGLVTTRALGFGLLYVLLWEGLIASFLSGIRYMSIRSFTLSILYGLNPQVFANLGDRVIDLPAAIVGSVGVVIFFVVLSWHRLRNMDVF